MMINKRLIAEVPEVRKDMSKNVLYQWLGLLSGIGFSFFLTLAAQHVILGLVPLSLMFIGFSAFFMIVRMIMSYLASQASSRVSRQVKTTLRERIMNHLMKLRSTSSLKHMTSEIVQLCTEGVEQLETYFALYLPQFFYAVLAPVTLFIVTCSINFKASLAACCSASFLLFPRSVFVGAAEDLTAGFG